MQSTARAVSIASILLSLSVIAHADVISDWNEKGVQATIKAAQPPFVQTRNIAIMHLAMFDAVNAIDRRYTPYREQPQVKKGASREAAAGAAAHLTLLRLYPDQAKDLDNYYTASIASIPGGEAKADGIRLGEQVASDFLDYRAKDGANSPIKYRPYTAPGIYVPTALPVAINWGRITPFALAQSSQFRPAPPPSLTSELWKKDCDEVKKMGAKVGSARTPDQTNIARFWEATGPVLHNPVLRQVALAKKLDVLDNARLFALYSMAMADSYIAVFDAKYTYAFWRPVTAIRNGDMGGQALTDGDDGWEPLIATPMHPEYPCAHCINSAAGAGVLEVFFGDQVPEFTMSSPTNAGFTRKFSRLSDYVNESIEARIYDGVHYRNSNEVGAAMGRKIAEYTVQNYLKPVH